MNKIPQAITAAKTDVTIINRMSIEEAKILSRQSARKRIILPYHKSPQDTLHRMMNVLQPGSYIRPHRHITQKKAESIIVLEGGICYITFDESGKISSYHELIAGSENFGVDTESHIYHSFYALQADTVIFEVKPGPYDPNLDKDFAEWAPAEEKQSAEAYLKQLMAKTDQLKGK